MLDCDISFLPVPEFTSSRSPLSARLMAATALAEGPQAASTSRADHPAQSAERHPAETFTAMRPAFFDSLPKSDLPPLPAVPPLADLRAEAAASHVSPAPEAPPAPEAQAEEPETRLITPRRPLRFTSARGAEDAAPVSLPSFNLFDGVFDDDSLSGPDVDPRLLRSRARARAHIAAMEAALAPEQRNLWHDDPAPEPKARPVMQTIAEPAAPIVAATAAEPATLIVPRRPVRHLTPADSTRSARPQPQIHDPLRDRLRDLRDILYTPTPEEAEAAAAAETRQHPLPALALAATLGMALQVLAFLTGLFLTVIQAGRTLRQRSHAAARPATVTATITATSTSPATEERAAPETTQTQPIPKRRVGGSRAARLLAPISRLTALWPARSFGPGLAAAAAAAATLAIPIGALASPALLPFL
ncbi:hypothetical protein [Tabrizicola sp. TH137]|uniref:hypothetical protein n=1 Tax=Tabrizicola sp. TH137 TaxID=2067452 RepID=UPI0013042482|nr:hypothetical protein [Tabrizicola sp. TH137]